MCAECQVLMLALDVVNYRENTNIDMFVFWQIVYMSSLFLCTIVLPFAYFFYETDEDQSQVRFLHTINYFYCFKFIFSDCNLIAY